MSTTTTAPAPAPSRGRRGPSPALLGALPFLLFVTVVLLLPIGVLAVEAFRATDPTTFEESWSTDSLVTATEGASARAYLGSLQLSAITAVLGTVLGLALAVAVVRAERGRLLRRLVLTASGVLANFGGIPLAFAFIATIGSTAGVITGLLTDLGLGLGGFSLYSMAGLALVYLYFLIPLMVLTITPALEALRPQWREASDNLGASAWQYWRHVGGPVLLPPVLGAMMLLFASAFAAYATAKALVGSSVPLVTLQIADALSSNVVVGSENLGTALALGMVVVVGLVMAFYAWVQRRTQRWLA
ncbi:ABC transporter permease [Blastococcus sp. TBT05-19]|nr:ABC transporter permease [Blastococcus sp. TBT05-19]